MWLWRRRVDTAPIQPLAWEPPYATEAAQEIATTTKDKKKKKLTHKLPTITFLLLPFLGKRILAFPKGREEKTYKTSGLTSGLQTPFLFIFSCCFVLFFSGPHR